MSSFISWHKNIIKWWGKKLNISEDDETLTLKNSKLIAPGPQVFSPNGCCSNQYYTKEYKIIHKSDKNNGADYGIYKITTKKATCFMNLEKGN